MWHIWLTWLLRDSVVDAPGTLTNIPSSLQKGGPNCNQKLEAALGQWNRRHQTKRHQTQDPAFLRSYPDLDPSRFTMLKRLTSGPTPWAITELIKALLDIFSCDLPCRQKKTVLISPHLTQRQRCWRLWNFAKSNWCYIKICWAQFTQPSYFTLPFNFDKLILLLLPVPFRSKPSSQADNMSPYLATQPCWAWYIWCIWVAHASPWYFLIH